MLLKKIVISLLATMVIMSCDNSGNVKPQEELIHIDGLSSKLVISSIPKHRSFSREIVNGYETLEEFSNDLDRLGYEAGLYYIESYEPWHYYIEDDLMVDSSPEKANSDVDDYETNNQVSGVDEADSVKSDGEFIYLNTGVNLLIFNLDGEIITDKNLFDNGYYTDNLLLYENKLITYSVNFENGSTISIFTVNNGEIISTEKFSSKSYITDMRMKDGNVIVFANSDLQLWDMFQNLFDDSYDIYGVSDLVGIDKEKAKERLKTEVPKWRNKLLLSLFGDGDNVDMDFVQNILKMYEQSNDKFYESFNEVFSFNVNNGFNNIKRSGAFSNGWNNAIYSNGSTSVISNSGWEYAGEFLWNETTYITTFNTDGTDTTPMSVAKLDGGVLNQFSMDIYDGHLRVGITENRWNDPNNSLVVLDESTLEEVGRLENLGEVNETITSMRFAGDKAYMVTFEQTDPFYTLDLSNPSNPTVLGELKINGFSSYIHPVDSETLLTIGMDADSNGWITGFQVSLYDVSNYSNPTRLFNKTMEGSWSDANWDHHGFRYVSSIEKLIIPVDDNFTIFDIDKVDGINIQGDIQHEFESYNFYHISERSLVIKGDIITIKHGTIRSTNIEDLSNNWVIKLDRSSAE